MTIRTFTMDDYYSALALWQVTEGVCNCEKCMKLDSREKIEKFLLRNPTTCFIAEENGRLLGTILGGHDGRNGFIYRLSVAEKFQRHGIGEALVNATTEAFKAEGINSIRLFVMTDNHKGNAFWEKLGFKEVNTAITRKR